MASLIPGYEYDIFISYRQKDNKGNRWVSEFVDSLKTELESTFKEEISVYFDINPHDGLLETHDVNASLKEKLKCLVFIPIISRTYCDPKSFAWEYEFKAFVEQASQDQFGLKVKLPNGNVANRVLPIRIHDLDPDDIKLCESITGGFLRGVEFVYKEPGIDKPLAPGDNEKKNLNNTTYKIQIIKVAHAIKEIILGMKVEPSQVVKAKEQPKESLNETRKDANTSTSEQPARARNIKIISTLVVIAILIAAGILLYPKIFKQNTLEKLRSSGGRISIAVMPFQNMTNDTIWNEWQDGVQEILTNSLSNSEELSVRQTESIKNLLQSKGLTNYATVTPSFASTISKNLGSDVFIYGNIIQAGSTIRVSAQLIDSKSKEVYKSFQIDGPAEKVLFISDSLSKIIKDFLIISKLKKDDIYYRKIYYSDSPEAYRYFIMGNKALFGSYDNPSAIKWYLQAINKDSTFTSAMIMLTYAYMNMNLFNQGKIWCLKANEKRDQLPIQLQILANRSHAIYFETPYESIKYLKQFREIYNQEPGNYYELGWTYFMELNQYDKAIPEFEKALEIYKEWGSKPLWIWNYTFLGTAYHKTGEYKKEKKLYKKAERDFPGHLALIYNQAILSLSEADTIKANQFIENYITFCKEDFWSEEDLEASLAGIYSEAGILEKAEGYYRHALSLEPERPGRMNTLAYFLIDNNRNIDEGLELIDRALKIRPENYYYLHTKGWGLYRQGKYKEAQELLQKSWDLRRQNGFYDNKAFLHLEEAKKAVSSHKIN